METGIIFALTLATLFFGCIIWLILYSRRKERQTNELIKEEPLAPKSLKDRRLLKRAVQREKLIDAAQKEGKRVARKLDDR